MTPETLTCDKCGAVKRIETDDPKYMEKKKNEFKKSMTDARENETRLPKIRRMPINGRSCVDVRGWKESGLAIMNMDGDVTEKDRMFDGS
jgi:hypothetical protein